MSVGLALKNPVGGGRVYAVVLSHPVPVFKGMNGQDLHVIQFSSVRRLVTMPSVHFL